MKQLNKLTRITAATLLLLLVCGTTTAGAQDTLKITLDDAIAIALSENPTVKVANKEIEKKKYAKRGVYANLFPQVSFGVDYNRTLKKQVMYMDNMDDAFNIVDMMTPITGGIEQTFQQNNPGYTPGSLMQNIQDVQSKLPPSNTGDQGIEVGRSNLWNTGFSAGMPLVSPTLWKSLQITGTDVELAVEQARSSKIAMTNEVKKAFYGVLLAKDVYEVFKVSYNNAVDNYNDIKKKYDQGLIAEYDLIRVNVRVNNIEPNLLEAENSVKLAKWNLKALMGMDLDELIDCAGSLADLDGELYADYLSTTETSLSNNSELMQIDLQTKMLSQSLKLHKLEFSPTLAATFFYQWSVMDNTFNFKDYKWNPYSMVGLSLSVPIFAGGGKINKIKETNVALTQVKLQREDAERKLNMAIRQATDQMSTCVKRFEASKRSIGEAEKGHSISLKRYDTGAGTLLELNDSELALTQARLNYNQAIFEYVVAKSNLERIQGEEK